MQIVLASTSASRRKIMANLRLPFVCDSPLCDETPLQNEDAQTLVKRLSEIKAHSLCNTYPNSLIIGADQVCVINGKITGKPHTFDNAMKQLRICSGQKITFYTGMTLLNSNTGETQYCCELSHVYFRELTDSEIAGYLNKEQPFACAGSFKCDELGITLFEKIECEDINALIGLPLIQLNKMLINWQMNPLLA